MLGKNLVGWPHFIEIFIFEKDQGGTVYDSIQLRLMNSLSLSLRVKKKEREKEIGQGSILFSERG